MLLLQKFGKVVVLQSRPGFFFWSNLYRQQTLSVIVQSYVLYCMSDFTQSSPMPASLLQFVVVIHTYITEKCRSYSVTRDPRTLKYYGNPQILDGRREVQVG